MQKIIEALEVAKARGGHGVERCPGCGQLITFKPALGGFSVDMLHPQPPCHTFRMLVEKLVQLADGVQQGAPDGSR